MVGSGSENVSPLQYCLCISFFTCVYEYLLS